MLCRGTGCCALEMTSPVVLLLMGGGMRMMALAAYSACHAVDTRCCTTERYASIVSARKCSSEMTCRGLPTLSCVPSGSSYVRSHPPSGTRPSSYPISATSHTDRLMSSTTSAAMASRYDRLHSTSVRRLASHPYFHAVPPPPLLLLLAPPPPPPLLLAAATPACAARAPEAAPPDAGRPCAAPAAPPAPSMSTSPLAAAGAPRGVFFSRARGHRLPSGRPPDLTMESYSAAVRQWPPTSDRMAPLCSTWPSATGVTRVPLAPMSTTRAEGRPTEKACSMALLAKYRAGTPSDSNMISAMRSRCCGSTTGASASTTGCARGLAVMPAYPRRHTASSMSKSSTRPRSTGYRSSMPARGRRMAWSTR
jgi:hypothetical protein